MYPKDVFRNSQTRSSKIQNMKYPVIFFLLAVALLYFRLTLGLYFMRVKFMIPVLNVGLVLIYVNTILFIYRNFIFKEKEKVNEALNLTSASSLSRYSKLENKSSDSSTYSYIMPIYMTDIAGFRTVYIKYIHFSKEDDSSISKEMFRTIFNYCMSNNLYVSVYNMNIGDDIQSLLHAEEVIKKASVPEEQLKRASVKLDYMREIAKSSRVTTEVIQISAMSMTNNLQFLDHIKILVNKMKSIPSTYKIQIMDKDNIEDFLKKYFKMSILSLTEIEADKVSNKSKNAIMLHKVTFEDGEAVEFSPINEYRKHIKVYKRGVNNEANSSS